MGAGEEGAKKPSLNSSEKGVRRGEGKEKGD